VHHPAADAIVAGLDFEAALQDPNMVKLQASQQVCTGVVAACLCWTLAMHFGALQPALQVQSMQKLSCNSGMTCRS
jgi:hypothetical protein